MAASALKGKIGVITGGSRGIGAAIARTLAAEGLTAVICGRDRAALDATANTIRRAGGQCDPAMCDVTSLADVLERGKALRVEVEELEQGSGRLAAQEEARRAAAVDYLRLASSLSDSRRIAGASQQQAGSARPPRA